MFGLFYYTADIWKFLAGTGTIYLSGASAAVILGLYWKRASTAGAAAALGLGLLGAFTAFPDAFARLTGLSGLASESGIALVTVAASWGAMVTLSLAFPDRAAVKEPPPAPTGSGPSRA